MIFLDGDADWVIKEVFVDREGVGFLFVVEVNLLAPKLAFGDGLDGRGLDSLFEVGAKLFASDVAFGDGFGGRLLGILFLS